MSATPRPAGMQGWPLIGRGEEMKVLKAAIDIPQCGGVALIGAAGVGKTRLATEFHAVAAARGLTTVQIRASHSASGIPLVALAPLFTTLGVEPDGAAAAVMAVGRALKDRDPEDRIVLFVDDAQELDEASTVVIDSFVGTPGTFVVLTIRSGDIAPERVAALWKDGHMLRVEVGPLPDPNIRELVRLALGGPVDGSTMAKLVGASRGNVLFLRELVAGVLASGALAEQDRLWRLSGSLVDSPGLRDLIAQGLGNLTDAERQAVELVALGEPIDLAVLDELVSVDVVESLEHRQILAAAEAHEGLEVRLAHPLYGEAVRAQLPAVRNVRLCRSLAAATERHAAGRELRPDELLRVALWRIESGDGDAELSVAAARRAFLGEDFSLASRLARHAWETGHKVEAARLLVDCLEDSGHMDESETILREAYVLAPTPFERASVVARLAATVFVWSGRSEEAERLMLDASMSLPDEACQRLIAAQRADMALLRGDVRTAIELAEPLMGGPRDPAFAQAARDLGVALALAGRSGAGIRLTEAALSARRDTRSVEEFARRTVFEAARSVALREYGRLEEARASAGTAYEMAVERRIRGAQAWFACVLGLTLVDQGQLGDAEHYFHEAATLFGEFGHPGQRWGLGGIALVAGQAGDRATAAAAVAELDALGPTPMRQMDVHIERGRAWAAIAGGDLGGARMVLLEAARLGEEWGQLASAAAALHDLVRIGDNPLEAAHRLAELSDRVDGKLMEARVEHARAVAEGDGELATQAAVHFESCGAYLFAAEAALLAQRLLKGDGLNRAANAAGVQAERLLQMLDGARTPALLNRGQRERLSTREREVALLAAAGFTSKEIADRLYLSVRTVDNHLLRAYTKLGVANRAALAEQLEMAPLG